MQEKNLLALFPDDSNSKRRPFLRVSSSKPNAAKALDRFYGFPGVRILSDATNNSTTCANDITSSPPQLPSGQQVESSSSPQEDVFVAPSTTASNVRSTNGDDASTCSWWEVVVHELNFRGKPSVSGPLIGSHTRGYAFHGECVVESNENENSPRNSARDARSLVGSDTDTKNSEAIPGTTTSSFGALGDAGKCNWLRTCSRTSSDSRPQYVTRVGSENAQSTTSGGPSLRVQLALNSTRPVHALETLPSRGGPGTTMKRIVDVLLEWAESAASDGTDSERTLLPAL